MFKYVIFILISAVAALFLFSHQKKITPNAAFENLKSQVGIPSLDKVKEMLPLSDYRKATPQLGLDFKPADLDPVLPYVRLQYLHNSTSAVVPADQVLTGITMFSSKPVKMIIENSSGYEIIRMYGSEESTFTSPQLVFDWSKRDLYTYSFEKAFFKYPYYMIEWKSLISANKSKQAHFFVEGQVATAPMLKLTYQPVHSGTKVQELSPKKEGQAAEPIFLRLRKNSLFGIKLETSDQKLQTCHYVAPHQPKSDCLDWMSTDFVASLTSSDVGRHQIEIQSDQGVFEYQFEIQALE